MKPDAILVLLICMMFSIHSSWSQNVKPEPETYIYKTIDGCEIHADVFLPNRDEMLKPVLVYIHGGALIYGSRTMIRKEHLLRFLDEGYVVVSIDYRLAPETKLPEIIEDLNDSFQWIHDMGEELFQADVERIGVIGQSAGGYLTLMAGVCVEPKPKVLISYYGYGDIVGDWYTKPDPFYNTRAKVAVEDSGLDQIGDAVSERGFSDTAMDQFYLYCRQNGLWTKYVGGVDPNDDLNFFTPYCPLQNVSKDYPPTLLLHGDQDTDVPYEQSVMMADELARHGVDHQFITIKDGEHVFDRRHDDPDVGAAFERVIEFLGVYLKE